VKEEIRPEDPRRKEISRVGALENAKKVPSGKYASGKGVSGDALSVSTITSFLDEEITSTRAREEGWPPRIGKTKAVSGAPQVDIRTPTTQFGS